MKNFNPFKKFYALNSMYIFLIAELYKLGRMRTKWQRWGRYYTGAYLQRDGKWNDLDCSNALFYICQKNAGNVTFNSNILVNMIINLTKDWHANWRLYFQILMNVWILCVFMELVLIKSILTTAFVNQDSRGEIVTQVFVSLRDNTCQQIKTDLNIQRMLNIS